jgi:hypothetical protein
LEDASSSSTGDEYDFTLYSRALLMAEAHLVPLRMAFRNIAPLAPGASSAGYHSNDLLRAQLWDALEHLCQTVELWKSNPAQARAHPFVRAAGERAAALATPLRRSKPLPVAAPVRQEDAENDEPSPTPPNSAQSFGNFEFRTPLATAMPRSQTSYAASSPLLPLPMPTLSPVAEHGDSRHCADSFSNDALIEARRCDAATSPPPLPPQPQKRDAATSPLQQPSPMAAAASPAASRAAPSPCAPSPAAGALESVPLAADMSTSPTSFDEPLSPEALMSVRVDTDFCDTDHVAAARWRAEAESARKLFSEEVESQRPRRRLLLASLALALAGAAAAVIVQKRRASRPGKPRVPDASAAEQR